MYEEKFPLRLSRLRMQKGVSARDMSLSLGQNPSYINNIENGKALPSMSGFFYICEYLKLTPRDFFDFDTDDPKERNELADKLQKLTPCQIKAIITLADGIIGKR